MEKSISLPVSVYALGGLGEVGKNMYCIENDETIIIIDAGVRFPGVEFPGIDYIVPDYTHLKNICRKIIADEYLYVQLKGCTNMYNYKNKAIGVNMHGPRDDHTK